MMDYPAFPWQKDEGTKKIEETNALAMQNTTRILRKLTNKPIDLRLCDMREIHPRDVSTIFTKEETFAGVYMDIFGDIKGRMLILFSKETALNLCDTIFQKTPTIGKRPNEFDEDAIKETANIIAGNYLSTLSNIMPTKMIQFLPKFRFDLANTLVESTTAPMLQETEKIFTIKLAIISSTGIFDGYMLLFFSQLAHEQIINILRR